MSINVLITANFVVKLKHIPTGPKAVPLADVTVHVFDFSRFGFCDKESKNFYDMTDMLVPMSNSALAVHCWAVIQIPSREALLIMTGISVDSQSNVGDIKLRVLVKEAQ